VRSHGQQREDNRVAELHTQLLLGIELGFCSRLDAADALGLTSELKKMLNSLRRKLGDEQP